MVFQTTRRGSIPRTRSIFHQGVSSSGLGSRNFTPLTGVQIPQHPPIKERGIAKWLKASDFESDTGGSNPSAPTKTVSRQVMILTALSKACCLGLAAGFDHMIGLLCWRSSPAGMAPALIARRPLIKNIDRFLPK